MKFNNPLKSSNRIFTKRLSLYFIVSLILQSIVAYGALAIFVLLPVSITGLPDDSDTAIQNQRGTLYLIKEHIRQHPEQSVSEIITELQPEFGIKLALLSTKKHLAAEVIQDLKKNNLAYDEERDIIYTVLDSGKILAVGPIDGDNVLDSHILALFIYLLLFAGFSAMTFCVLLYFAFSYLWRDAKNMSITVDELGKGNLQVRAKPAQSWLFKQLAGVINTMCDQIEKLISSNRIILHAMAHELRTPLARMNFEVEMLTDATNDSEKKRLTNEINNDIKELEVLINTSLNYFKLQQSQVTKNITPVSLRSWAMDIIDNLEYFKPDNFTLECKIADKTVYLDEILVETIIKNLLLNTFKYAANQATIEINQKDDLLFIIIDDDGPGIPLDSREKVFLPFSRIDTSRTKATGGYGLGLAYVKMIAESCQGKAFVVTSPLGGARFVITLNFS